MPKPTHTDVVGEIRRIYYEATSRSIHKDLARAISLLKTLETEADRERAAVFMDGLSQMRSEWAQAQPRTVTRPPGTASRK